EAIFALETAGRDALAGSVRVGARQLATIRALAAGAVTARDLADAGGSAAAARALARRGLVLAGTRAVRRVPAEFALADDDRARDLPATGPQAVAIGAITAALGSGRGFLLHGVTASGKTEVYLRAATAALARGDGVIVLVPEIILTAQVVARFIARFGERVALLHSALSAGERFDEWRRVLDGVADVVIGSRSALFAPLERVGLVVVDEEQEPSYKQESDPRYHAVDTAIELGRITGAVVVLGSATPRVVTYEAAASGARRSAAPRAGALGSSSSVSGRSAWKRRCARPFRAPRSFASTATRSARRAHTRRHTNACAPATRRSSSGRRCSRRASTFHE